MSDGDKLQWVQCPECNGLGAWKNNESDFYDDWIEVCDTCHGDGEIQVDADIPTTPLTPDQNEQGQS